ncbi:MAG: hypothetical protein R2795_02305 [Saprospiraceae bacterium]
MLLTPENKTHRHIREQRWIIAGIISCALLLIALLIKPTASDAVTPIDSISCNMEHTRGDVFINGKREFPGAAFLSSQKLVPASVA